VHEDLLLKEKGNPFQYESRHKERKFGKRDDLLSSRMGGGKREEAPLSISKGRYKGARVLGKNRVTRRIDSTSKGGGKEK